MASLKIKGQITKVFPTEVKSEKLKLAKIWVKEKEGQYPQQLEFKAVNKAIDKLDYVKVGDVVEIDANVKGFETNNGNLINSLELWFIKKVDEVQPPQPQVASGKIDAFANPIQESFEPPF